MLRQAKPPREWCTDGVAASASAPGAFGPVLAFRGEIEAQGRGSLHPHILVWLLTMSAHELLRILNRRPALLRARLATWMKTTVAAMESTCQSSVQALPRQFGDLDTRLAPLPFSRVEQRLSMFDGGTELDVLKEEAAGATDREAPQPMRTFLAAADPDDWRRPLLPVRDKEGEAIPDNTPALPRESVYSKCLGDFAVSQCPSYRRHGDLRSRQVQGGADDGAGPCEHASTDGTNAAAAPVPVAGPEPPPATTAGVWQQLFGDDVRRLAAEILVHICGDSCFKYSGSKVTQICRHGYFYIISIADEKIGLDWKERRRGKALRNILFVIKEEEHGMQGRVLLFQEHPFECQSNYGALAFLRSNFDVQDLRRVYPTKEWLSDAEDLPHLGDRPGYGYMDCFECASAKYPAR